MEEYGKFSPNSDDNGMPDNGNDGLPGSNVLSDQNDVKIVNIVFLAIVILPRILIELGFGKILMANYTADLFLSQVIYGLPVLIYLVFVKKSAKICRFKKIRISDIFICLLIYICTYPVLMLLNAISLLYSKNSIGSVVFQVSTEIPFLLGIIIVAVIPPFCEELTYRGVFYNTYRKVNPLGAIFLSSALFGILHGNLNQLTYALLLGCFFALIVEATDSIFSSMIVHGLVNAISTVLVYLIPKALEYLRNLLEEARAAGDSQTTDMLTEMFGDDLSLDAVFGEAVSLSKSQILMTISTYLFPAAIGGFLAFMLFRFLARRNGRWELVCDIFKNPRKNGKIITAPLAVALVLLVATLVLNELVTRGIITL